MTYEPVWVGVLASSALLSLGIFLYLALTHPLAQRICQAASSPAVGTRQQRLAALTRCPACGYNTAQTVIDGRHQCPECGEEISYNNIERGWLVDQQQQSNTQP